MKISPPIFDYICDRFERHVYPANEIIFQEGEMGSAMYIVIEGELEVSLHGNILDRLTSGDLFGEMSIVSDRPRSGSVTTIFECTLIPIAKPQFMILLAESAEFAIEVMGVMAQRLQHWMEEEVKRQRLEEEIAIGQRIQLSLLPAEMPEIPGWQFAAFYRAARQVGGDFYDFIKTPGNPTRQDIVIGDVSGKGVPAALFMAVARTMIRAAANNGRNPAALLTHTNNLIKHDNRSSLFLSTLYASLDTVSGQLTFASAGHESPLLIRYDSEQIKELTIRGLVLGAFTSVSYIEKKVMLNPGDAVVFYTDGVTEARDTEGRFYGDRRLGEALSKSNNLTADNIVKRIVASVAAFTNGAPQADDLTILVIKRG